MKRTTRFSALVCLMADDTDKNACGSEKNGLAYEKKKQHFTESHALKISCGILLSTSRWGEGPLEGHAGSLAGCSVGLESRLLFKTEDSG